MDSLLNYHFEIFKHRKSEVDKIVLIVVLKYVGVSLVKVIVGMTNGQHWLASKLQDFYMCTKSKLDLLNQK